MIVILLNDGDKTYVGAKNLERASGAVRINKNFYHTGLAIS